ncbi:GTP-binding protein [Streptomyces sp. NBC_00859]|uniref:GTP-binding protein n=1 Tax=Streptomyces sp. NBC_00859 TaxID=2903682 RepID=UPI00386DB2B2|nr:ATP/GTP-binding protein [Streptomyces sp. NBC_00859]
MKIVVAGHFGAGKTTFIGTLSEIRPLSTEEVMTTASEGTDSLAGLPHKTTTTVAMDFGRRTLSEDLVLYMFGAPGQARFDFLEGLVQGALGALVLADTRVLAESFPVIQRLEELGVPYAIAINVFDNHPERRDYTVEQLRSAMDLEPGTPLVLCDARDRLSAKQALITLVTYLLTLPPEPS